MKAILLLATIALVSAEPPAPNSQYLPSNQYGPPSHTQAVTKPNGAYGPPGGSYLPPGGGYGGGQEEQTEPANYKFEYHVEDAESGNDFGHEEERQGDVATGKYFVLLPDGRKQTVEYTADSEGYKPKITYEEVGNNGGYPSGRPEGNGGYQY